MVPIPYIGLESWECTGRNTLATDGGGVTKIQSTLIIIVMACVVMALRAYPYTITAYRER